MKLRIVGRVLLGVVALYGVLTAGLYVAMKRPPDQFGAIMSHVPMVSMIVLPFEPLWMSARGGTLRVGDAAPDFALPTLDRARTVKLSDELREHPVALIFGSYT